MKSDFKAKGFVPGRDKVGYAGVEFTFQNELAGKNGERLVEVDNAGKEIRNLEAPIAPTPGNSLTINHRFKASIGSKNCINKRDQFLESVDWYYLLNEWGSYCR